MMFPGFPKKIVGQSINLLDLSQNVVGEAMICLIFVQENHKEIIGFRRILRETPRGLNYFSHDVPKRIVEQSIMFPDAFQENRMEINDFNTIFLDQSCVSI